MRPSGAIRSGLLVLLAMAGPCVAKADPAPRTGPEATPPQAPTYAQPAPALALPLADYGAARARAPGGAGVAIRVVAEGVSGAAKPPVGWHPPQAPEQGLRLDHKAGEALDAPWVRRQFEINGFSPGGDIGRVLDLVQLINRAFLSAGFVDSGVLARSAGAPDALELRVVHGGLTPPAGDGAAVEVAWVDGKSKGLDAGYIRDRFPSTRQRPLSAVDLERDFRLLAEDPALRTLNAELRPGARPGEASLALTVYPQDRFDLYVTAANNRSPSVGGERLAFGGSVRNAALAGDILQGELGLTDGVKDAALSYAAPFFSPRATASIRGALNDAAVVDRRLAPLDIKARDKLVEGGVSYKLIDAPLLPLAQAGRWSPARTLSAGLLVSWRESKAYLLGAPFSFAPGAVNGRTDYTAVRFVGDYVLRNVDQVFAVSVTASQGLYGTRSSTPGADDAKRHFHAILTQVNYARRLSPQGLELRARVSGQLADGVLYSGERFSAGGESTVRGYRENLILADSGVVGSLELAQPLKFGDRQGAARAFNWNALTLSGFVDGARMRNHRAPQPERSLYSVGAGLAWTPSDALSARLSYAYALKPVETPGSKDIQDRGLAFRITVRPLRMANLSPRR